MLRFFKDTSLISPREIRRVLDFNTIGCTTLVALLGLIPVNTEQRLALLRMIARTHFKLVNLIYKVFVGKRYINFIFLIRKFNE